MEKSFCRNIKRFDLHHNALAGDLDDFDFALTKYTYIKYTFKLFGFWLLVDLSLGAALWRKASVEISDALIHIKMPFLNADGLDYFDFAPLRKYRSC